MTAPFLSSPVYRCLDASGAPLAGGLLYSYVAGGASTPKSTYSDAAGLIANTNPVVLDTTGSATVRLEPGAYHFVQMDSSGTTTLWDEDYYSAPYLTSLDVGGLLYPATAAETAVGANPVLSYPYGAFRRYGMDPTGGTDCAAALAVAWSCNSVLYDDYPGGGTYLLNSTPSLSNYPVQVRGQAINYGGIAGPNAGTAFQLSSAAGANAAVFKFPSAAYGIVLENMSLLVQDNQYGIYAVNDFRNSVLRHLYIRGNSQLSSNQAIGIYLAAGGTVTEGVVIENCGTANVQYGITLGGTCTTVKIHHCELNGNTAASAGAGINVGNTVAGACADHCLIEGFATAGILNQSAYWSQEATHFEQGTAPVFIWTRGAGNARLWASSTDDKFISGTAPQYPINNIDYCKIDSGPGYAYWDNTVINAGLGFQEHLRSTGLGDFIHLDGASFAAGNYTASGSQTFTVLTAQVTDHSISVHGHTATMKWSIAGSTIGGTPSTAIRLLIPGGFTAKGVAGNPVSITNNGSASTGWAQVADAGTYVSIYLSSAASPSNWSASAGNAGTFGMIQFEVN